LYRIMTISWNWIGERCKRSSTEFIASIFSLGQVILFIR
jgi:hypothetical protein